MSSLYSDSSHIYIYIYIYIYIFFFFFDQGSWHLGGGPLTEATRAKNDGHGTPCPGVPWGLFGSRPRVFGSPPSPLTEATRAKASSNGTPCPGVPRSLFGSYPRVFGSPP